MIDLVRYIAQHINVRPEQIEAAIALLDDKSTIPFIARYRKEATGGLDEEQLRNIDRWLVKLRALEERRIVILKSIEEQGKLTLELKLEIDNTENMTALEDLYQPYKPKRRTRASIARERGLQELADMITQQSIIKTPLAEIARKYLSDEVHTFEEAWSGARDIVAEIISDHPEIRRVTRDKALQWGLLRSEKVTDAFDEKKLYANYYSYEYSINRLRPHQILAINRGEREKILHVRIIIPDRDWRKAIADIYPSKSMSVLAEQMDLATEDAAKRLLLPAIERDVRRELTKNADVHAIGVFAVNLRALLFQPPLTGHTIMGIDPGFRTGCKIAVVDPTGRLLETNTIYPHPPQREWERSVDKIGSLVSKYGITLIGIGNGTASRETEQLVADFIRSRIPGVKYILVSEAGASVYSASPLARSELPDLDVSLRGAVSIARRIQDPLAELVKIEPRSIGVGLYQHDVDQGELSDSLDDVVESVVNQVGVDVNTASPALLTYVSGIGPKLAERIVEYRNQNGAFSYRFALNKIPGLGSKAFEQAAGFLRINDGDNPLDATMIHPESYPIVETLLNMAGIKPNTPLDKLKLALDELIRNKPIDQLAREIHAGIPTLEDIFEQLIKPGRDPRTDAALPLLRSDVLSVEDLVIGMKLVGSVRNVVDFGVFIDIGVKLDGLLHRSKIPAGIQLKVGNVIDVEILKVEGDRGRIGLGWVSETAD
jgi:uncharacterized protein